MAPYDIVRKLPDGSKIWMGEVSTMREAKWRLRQLQRDAPAEYYVCDITARRVLSGATPRWPELHLCEDDSIFVQNFGALS